MALPHKTPFTIQALMWSFKRKFSISGALTMLFQTAIKSNPHNIPYIGIFKALPLKFQQCNSQGTYLVIPKFQEAIEVFTLSY
jgi:hypothetical protein